ncbi:hypothetical protein BaRGS_00008906 [Batillaria attramentaria]|uniref:Secreted protein n=1 Tax=Batillaria attramentaria TaxID=370345 RepID=A0ABD0LK74_9CAEN
MEMASSWKPWAPGRLQVLSLVLISSSWLLDPAIRSAVCRCVRMARADHVQDNSRARVDRSECGFRRDGHYAVAQCKACFYAASLSFCV